MSLARVLREWTNREGLDEATKCKSRGHVENGEARRPPNLNACGFLRDLVY